MREDGTVRGRVSLLAAVLLLAPAPALGHDTPAGPEKPTDVPADWGPPAPDPTEHDWIQLNSHELLKGKIKRLQNGIVRFDSDKLDDLEFDWDDVIGIVTAREHTFRFAGRRIVVGTCEMRGDLIRIRVEDEVQQFERSDLVSMVLGAGRERDYWSARLGMGLSGQTGNTSQLSFNSSLSVERRTPFREAAFRYTGNVATQTGDLSANSHRASIGTSFYLTRRFFLNIPRLEYQQDQFQNIDWRITPSVGVGYDVFWTRKLKWQVGAAAGFQAVKYDSVASGSDRSNDAPLLFLSRLDIDLPKRFEWTNVYQLQLIVTEVGNSNQHLSSTLSFDFWGPLDFDATFQWDWVAQPQEDDQGNVPKRSDVRISVGLAVDL